jgi:hypothetical protein
MDIYMSLDFAFPAVVFSILSIQHRVLFIYSSR